MMIPNFLYKRPQKDAERIKRKKWGNPKKYGPKKKMIP